METMVSTPADVAGRVTSALDAWDGRIRVDVEVDGCRLQVADMGTRVYVEYIAVPDRRSGYGAALLTALTGWADRRQVTLEVGPSNEYGTSLTVLRRWYARHGFTPTGPASRPWSELTRHPASETK